jgi:hypothetical protein
VTARGQQSAAVILDALCDLIADEHPCGESIAKWLRDEHGEDFMRDTASVLRMLFGECAKADENEPIFTLRAQDKSAVAALGMWITFAERDGASAEKLDGARERQRQTVEWQAAHADRVKAAD